MTAAVTLAAMGNGPAFSAYQTTASGLGAGVWTKVAFTGETYDTNSCYDAPNSRFTPTVAGYYQFNSVVMTSTNVAQVLTVWKNATPANIRGVYGVSNGGSTVSGIIYMNGTTDYAEVYLYQSSAILTDGTANSWFQAALVRGA